MAFAWHLSQTLPRRICQKLTHLRKLVSRISLYSKLALALVLALVLLDSEDGLKILTGGEWGLFMRPSAVAWPLRPPLHPRIERKFFVSIQSAEIEQPSKFLDSRSIRSLHQTMEQVDGETLAWFRDRRSVFEYRSVIRQFLPNRSTKTSSCKWLKLLRFFVFVKFSSTFIACANFIPKFSENIFSSNPQ